MKSSRLLGLRSFVPSIKVVAVREHTYFLILVLLGPVQSSSVQFGWVCLVFPVQLCLYLSKVVCLDDDEDDQSNERAPLLIFLIVVQ